jgi:hypothetical protein
MSDLQDVIAHNAQKAYQQGLTRERERWEAWLARIRTWTLDKSADYQEGALFEQRRIIKLLEPHAEHDEAMCYLESKRECYPEDCSAPLIQWVIELIKGEQK